MGCESGDLLMTTKPNRTMRFDERTWGQLAALKGPLKVGSRTKVIEVLAERESVIMESNNLTRIVEILKRSGYTKGKVTRDTFIVYTGDETESFAIEKPDPQTAHPDQIPGSTYCTAIDGITLKSLNQSLP